MKCSLIPRRLLIGVSIAMLVLCQTAAAALVYVAPPTTSVATQITEAPCHRTNNTGDDAPTRGCKDRCPARDTTFETAKINIPAADSFAPVAVVADSTRSSLSVVAPYEHVPANAAPPPPLLLVYCRLLI